MLFMTDQFQPLDLTLNGPAKAFLIEKFETWYANQVTEQLEKGTEVYQINVPLTLSILKPIQARWIIGLYDTIIKGFS